MDKLKRLIYFLLSLWIIGFGVFIFACKNIKNKEEYVRYSIVLTGGQDRIPTAIDLLERNLTSVVFISGVNEQADKRAILGEDYNRYKYNFILGYDSNDTKTNVDESKKWVSVYNIDEVRIITSDYHIFRSFLEFDKKLDRINKHTYVVKNINLEFMKSFYNWKLLLSEYNKLIYVFITGVFS